MVHLLVLDLVRVHVLVSGEIRGQTHRGLFGVEKLDHPSDRWSVVGRAARAHRAAKVINDLDIYIRKKYQNTIASGYIYLLSAPPKLSLSSL